MERIMQIFLNCIWISKVLHFRPHYYNLSVAAFWELLKCPTWIDILQFIDYILSLFEHAEAQLNNKLHMHNVLNETTNQAANCIHKCANMKTI